LTGSAAIADSSEHPVCLLRVVAPGRGSERTWLLVDEDKKVLDRVNLYDLAYETCHSFSSMSLPGA